MRKLLSVGLVFVLVALATGCASVNEAMKTSADVGYKLAKDGSGVVYGPVVSTKHTVGEVCKVVLDSRCVRKDDFQAVMVIPAVGYAEGGTFLMALAPVNMTFTTGSTGCSNCDYLKVQLEPGKIGTVLEKVSTGGDGKCRWSGMPRVGGTVCPAYNWDYRKDMRNWDTTNGVMTVKD